MANLFIDFHWFNVSMIWIPYVHVSISRDKYWKCSYVEDNYNFSSWRVRVNNMVSSAEHRRVEVIIRVKMEFYEIS